MAIRAKLGGRSSWPPAPWLFLPRVFAASAQDIQLLERVIE